MGSKAEYSIDLDVEDQAAGIPILRSGDRLRGTATVRARDDLKLNSLAVQLVWKAHGKGSSEEGVVDETRPEHLQGLTAGREEQVSFELVLPGDAPLSYDGEYVKVTWFLRIYLDIPWAVDDEECYPLLVLPNVEE